MADSADAGRLRPDNAEYAAAAGRHRLGAPGFASKEPTPAVMIIMQADPASTARDPVNERNGPRVDGYTDCSTPGRETKAFAGQVCWCT